MADTKKPSAPPKVEEPKSDFQVEPGLMSLDELDSAISETDPEALQNLESVREIGATEGSPTLELLQVDEYLNENKNHNHKADKFLLRIKSKSLILWIWFKNRALDDSKRFAAWLVDSLRFGKQQIQKGFKTFGSWSLKAKLSFSGAIILTLVAVVFSYFAFVKQAFKTNDELFMRSMLSWSEGSWEMSYETSLETFYNSSRIPKNVFKLKRMVVNIRPSENSGSNPMVAYEFSLEGNSTEVLIEIKDREGEIIDQVQRAIEGYSFDELKSPEGKKMITEKVRSTINRLLTLGKIRYVYIQGVIFKP